MSRVYGLTRMQVNEGAQSHWPPPGNTCRTLTAPLQVADAMQPLLPKRDLRWRPALCAAKQAESEADRTEGPRGLQGCKTVGPSKRIWARATTSRFAARIRKIVLVTRQPRE